MRLHRIALAAAAAAAAFSAAAQTVDPKAVQQPIKGSDATGDKGRTGPDGWSWAPQTRDQAPADGSGQTAASGPRDANSLPGPNTAAKLAPGDDPGAPAATDAHGPGTVDAASGRKP